MSRYYIIILINYTCFQYDYFLQAMQMTTLVSIVWCLFYLNWFDSAKNPSAARRPWNSFVTNTIGNESSLVLSSFLHLVMSIFRQFSFGSTPPMIQAISAGFFWREMKGESLLYVIWSTWPFVGIVSNGLKPADCEAVARLGKLIIRSGRTVRASFKLLVRASVKWYFYLTFLKLENQIYLHIYFF